jgi:hypothetical protein
VAPDGSLVKDVAELTAAVLDELPGPVAALLPAWALFPAAAFRGEAQRQAGARVREPALALSHAVRDELPAWDAFPPEDDSAPAGSQQPDPLPYSAVHSVFLAREAETSCAPPP